MGITHFIAFSALLLAGSNRNDHEGLYVDHVSQPSICLNGVWKVTNDPPDAFWSDTTRFDEWQDIRVPGECMMQGVPIHHDKPFVYHTTVFIPEDYAGNSIYLQFDGVYSYARLWVNGHQAREHHGGFTRWTSDITSFVQAGQSASVTLEVTDRIDDISYASGYAKHPIGGILRDVYLLAQPKTFPDRLFFTTDLDGDYKNALLNVSGELNRPAPGARIELELTDIHQNAITLDTPSLRLTPSKGFSIQNTVHAPYLWDAEHPNLYRLTVSFLQHDTLMWRRTYPIGFREIEVAGDRLLVNGKQVKLRGACRHDIHPLLGRSASDEYDLKDVLLAKEANMNFIRTSHYPPSERFLNYCDQYGLYVEEETAVCFVGTWRSDAYKPYGATQDDTTFTDRYLGQLAEMIERDRSHPSVLIWSIGNENKYGSNFRREFDYVKKMDSTRPVMFSYPGFGSDDKIYDILSVHYPSYTGASEQYGFKVERFAYPGIPVLNDEWAHVACYNTATLKSDLNVRDFWGQSLDRIWSNCFDSDGALGGAIWGMIDETFMLPKSCVGYGPWGLVDTWRRKKPEFWNTKKAYSPVRLARDDASGLQPGKDISLRLQNRFDHTNIAELTITCNGKSLPSPDIAPHRTGALDIPGECINADGQIEISFKRGDALIDRYQFTSQPQIAEPDKTREARERVQVQESDTELVVTGSHFEIILSKDTGLMTSASCNGIRVIERGPFVTLIPAESNPADRTGPRRTSDAWVLEDMSWKLNNDTSFAATMLGRSGEYPVAFTMTIAGQGEIQIDYQVSHPLKSASQAGIHFIVADQLDRLSWDRHSYWSVYPKGHLGRPRGTAFKTCELADSEQYRKPPQGRWETDTRDFYLFGASPGAKLPPVTRDFRSTKMSILRYALTSRKNHVGLEVISDGRLACRTSVEEDGSMKLFILEHICYPDLDWGNYEGDARIPNPFRSHVQIKLIQPEP